MNSLEFKLLFFFLLRVDLCSRQSKSCRRQPVGPLGCKDQLFYFEIKHLHVLAVLFFFRKDDMFVSISALKVICLKLHTSHRKQAVLFICYILLHNLKLVLKLRLFEMTFININMRHCKFVRTKDDIDRNSETRLSEMLKQGNN